ncbi:MAG: hypothetical protein ACFFF9_15850 [Candidatus Thorarchaeota archaeon]
MGLRSPISSEWLRKGRRVEDRKILHKILEDSSSWKISKRKLSETLFEKKLDLKPLPEVPMGADTINSVLGQSAVTEFVRVNKNDLSPTGNNLRQEVESLLPGNLTDLEASSLSYVLSRIAFDEIPAAFRWPVIPEGMDSLAAAMYTVNIIAQQTGNTVRWLLPVWTLKTNEYKLNQLKEVSNVLVSGDDDDIEEAMMTAKMNIEEFLGKDSFSGQDSLSVKLDSWRDTIENHKKSEDNLWESRKQFSQARKDGDGDPKVISDYEDEVQRLEKEVDKQSAKMKLNRLALEHEIQTLRTQNQLFTEWNIYSLHPAGPTSYKHEYLLKNIRHEVNIMGYTPLIKLCGFLRTSEQPGRPSASDLVKEVGLKQRMANYTLVRLGYLLSEHYLISPAALGLRYRYILTETQKPAVKSEGLIERLTMQMNDIYSGCTVHLEPISSDGPADDILPYRSLQLTVDSEILSMRLNLFDDREGLWDMTSAYETNPLKATTIKENSKWLYRTTNLLVQETPHLSPMELDLLGILHVFSGLRNSRRWLFEQLGYNQVTSRRYLKRLFDSKVLRLLYLPTLEYCGLPVGLIVGGMFRTQEIHKRVKDWMVSKLPFARVLNDGSSNMIAYLRLPADAVTTVRSMLREVFVSEATDWFISSVLANQTYKMTVFNRLYRADRDGWIDPWV